MLYFPVDYPRAVGRGNLLLRELLDLHHDCAFVSLGQLDKYDTRDRTSPFRIVFCQGPEGTIRLTSAWRAEQNRNRPKAVDQQGDLRSKES